MQSAYSLPSFISSAHPHFSGQPSLGPSLMSSLSGSAAIPPYLVASPRSVDRGPPRRPSFSPPGSPLSGSASARCAERRHLGPGSPRSAKSASDGCGRHSRRSQRHRRPRSVPGSSRGAVTASTPYYRALAAARPRWVASGCSQTERIEYPVHL